jgi:hypothetical protein
MTPTQRDREHGMRTGKPGTRFLDVYSPFADGWREPMVPLLLSITAVVLLVKFPGVLNGRGGNADWAADYIGARALIHHADAYPILGPALAKLGLTVNVDVSHTHPPTAYVFALPFVWMKYPTAVAAWGWCMVAAYAATVRLLGVRWLVAIPAATIVAFVSPFSEGIRQFTPLILLGGTLVLTQLSAAPNSKSAELMVAAGLALSTLPKLTGALLFVPVLLKRSWLAAIEGALLCAGAAIIAVALSPGVIHQYLTEGASSTRFNIHRQLNAAPVPALLHRLSPAVAGIAIAIGLALLVVALLRRGREVAPYLVASVAVLPIAWSYSVTVLASLWILEARRGGEWALVALAPFALIVAFPTYGLPMTTVVPLVVGLSLALVALSPSVEPASMPPTPTRRP